jgi:hypothetical protein
MNQINKRNSGERNQTKTVSLAMIIFGIGLFCFGSGQLITFIRTYTYNFGHENISVSYRDVKNGTYTRCEYVDMQPSCNTFINKFYMTCGSLPDGNLICLNKEMSCDMDDYDCVKKFDTSHIHVVDDKSDELNMDNLV